MLGSTFVSNGILLDVGSRVPETLTTTTMTELYIDMAVSLYTCSNYKNTEHVVAPSRVASRIISELKCEIEKHFSLLWDGVDYSIASRCRTNDPTLA